MEMPVRGTKEYWEWLKGVETAKGISSRVYAVSYTVHLRYLNKPISMTKRTDIRIGDCDRGLEQLFKDRFRTRAEMEYANWGPSANVEDITINSFYQLY